jgi:capsular exopolysaccharide synthesis family protein
LTPASLLRAVRRRWVFALSVGLLCSAVAGIAVWLFLPPATPEARTLLQVPPDRPWLLKVAGEAPPDLLSHQKTQVALVKSHLVLGQALEDPTLARFDLGNNAANLEWLEEAVEVDFSVAPEILRIAMRGRDREKIVALIKAITKAYFDEVVRDKERRRQQRREKLADLRQKLEGQLRDVKEKQRKMEPEAGHKDAAVRTLMLGFLQQQLTTNEHELLQTQTQLRKDRLELATQRAKLQSLSEKDADEQTVDEWVDADQLVIYLRHEEHTVHDDIQRTLENAKRGEDEPEVIRLRQQLEGRQKALAQTRARLRPEAVRKALNKVRRELYASIGVLEAKVSTLEGNEHILAPEVERLRKRVMELPAGGAKLDQFLEEVGHLEELTKRIVKEEQALAVEAEAPVLAKVLEEPYFSAAKTKDRRPLVSGLAALGALALVVLGTGWWEWRAGRVAAADEVIQGLGLSLIGTLPACTGTPLRGVQEPGPAGMLIESIDAARTVLVSAARARSVRVVMVVSAAPGEGKTSLVCHLAASLSRAGLRTLVVDGDLRNPVLHTIFKLPNPLGFAEVLRGEVEAASVIQQTTFPGLCLLSAGRCDAVTLRCLAQGRARVLFGRLREQYDFVLVDSSPLLVVADPLSLGQDVDAVLFSILQEVSRIPSVCTAMRRLSALGIRTLGAVINGVAEAPPPAHYRYSTPLGHPGAQPQAPPGETTVTWTS